MLWYDFSFGKEKLKTKRSMKDVPGVIVTVRFGAVQIVICVYSPRWRYSSMGPSNDRDYFVALRRVGSLIRFNQSHHLSRIMKEPIWFTIALVCRRHVAVHIMTVAGPYNFWSSQVSFSVRAMSLTCCGNSSISASEILHLQSCII